MGRGRAKQTGCRRRRSKALGRSRAGRMAGWSRDKATRSLPGPTVDVKSGAGPGASMGHGRAKQTGRRR